VTGNTVEFFVAFPVIWVAVVFAIGKFSGWTRLAGQYPSSPQVGGRCFRFQSGRMRFGAGYGSCLTVGSDPNGLHVSILFLFRPGHCRLFFPWSEITVHQGSRRGVLLRFSRVPDVPIILSKVLVAQLAEASSGGISYPTAT
jgi:hypothetical protein